MSESGFLEDGFKDLAKQREQQRLDAVEKRKAGFAQVKALDPMDGNKLKILWVKKDEPTLVFEAEEAKKKEIAKRHQEIERKKKMLDLVKFEAELAEKEAELVKIEKELEVAGKKAAEIKASR